MIFKYYEISSFSGNYKIISISKEIALYKAYRIYKRTRKNTGYSRFKNSISCIKVSTWFN